MSSLSSSTAYGNPPYAGVLMNVEKSSQEELAKNWLRFLSKENYRSLQNVGKLEVIAVLSMAILKAYSSFSSSTLSQNHCREVSGLGDACQLVSVNELDLSVIKVFFKAICAGVLRTAGGIGVGLGVGDFLLYLEKSFGNSKKVSSTTETELPVGVPIVALACLMLTAPNKYFFATFVNTAVVAILKAGRTGLSLPVNTPNRAIKIQIAAVQAAMIAATVLPIIREIYLGISKK